MTAQNLSELTDQELLQKLKKLKSNKIIDACLVGFTIGIALYSVFNKGVTFFVFVPLILAYPIIRNSKDNKILEREIEKELESRKTGL